MRVLVVGDTHGNDYFLQSMFANAKNTGCEKLLVVGDFGFWPGELGLDYLDRCESMVERFGVELYALDGNHDWHEFLEPHYADENPWEFRPGCFYLGRGMRFELDGLKCMSMGGAWSIDRAARTQGVDWWPQEEPNGADLERALERIDSQGQLDVLFTHDMPADATQVWTGLMFAGGNWTRNAVQTLINAGRPKLHLHGHMHHKYSFSHINGCATEGLDCDGTGSAAYYVLDTNDWK